MEIIDYLQWALYDSMTTRHSVFDRIRTERPGSALAELCLNGLNATSPEARTLAIKLMLQHLGVE